MKIHLAIGLLCLFTAVGMAQRGGGHGGGGAHMGGGGGFHGGSAGGFSGGGSHFGGYGGIGGGSHFGGYGGIGVGRYGGFGGNSGYRGFYGNRFGIGFGLGYYGGYWPGYYGGYYGYPYGYGYGYDYGYPYSDYNYGSYSAPVAYNYNPSPNVTVVYAPPSQPAYNAYGSAQGGYDQYGQPMGAPAAGGSTRPPGASASAGASPTVGGSPIYLIAFKDHTIRAAASYSVNGNTLRYVTLEHEEKQAPLDSVDRGLSAQLNYERHVAFTLPNQ